MKLTELDLSTGLKIRRKAWDKVGIQPIEDFNAMITLSNALADDWELFHEPKRKKTITLYAAVYHNGYGFFHLGEYRCQKPEIKESVVGIATMEVEVSE
jgi:hypothetical protein